MAKSTSVQFEMFNQETCADSSRATSSPVSVSGPMLFDRQDGETIDPFGPEAAPASHSAKQGSGKELQTNGTSGRNGSGLSASAGLSASLANRLALRCLTAGSTLFAMGWSRVVTPSGRVISRLAASGRRTSGNDCTSWLTPLSLTNTDGHQAGNNKFDNQVKAVIGWPSPNAGPQNDSDTTWMERRKKLKAEGRNGNGFGMTTGMASQLTGWPTPKTPTGGPESGERKQQLGRTESGGGDLAAAAEMAFPWATPRAEDAESAGMRHGRGTADTLSAQAGQDFGPTSAGTTAATASTGRFLLNPRFSLWLQGLPEEWASCGERATLSMRKPRKRS